MFNFFKAMNFFKIFKKDNLEKMQESLSDKTVYQEIGGCFLLIGILAVPFLMLSETPEKVMDSMSIYFSGAIVFCLVFFVFKKPKK